VCDGGLIHVQQIMPLQQHIGNGNKQKGHTQTRKKGQKNQDLDVQMVRGLIHEPQIRLLQQCTGNGDVLFLAATHQGRRRVEFVLVLWQQVVYHLLAQRFRVPRILRKAGGGQGRS